MVSSGNCSKNSRERFEPGRTELATSARAGALGTNGERMFAALYVKLSYALICGSGSMRSPGRALISATCACSLSMSLEQPPSNSNASVVDAIVLIVVVVCAVMCGDPDECA